MPDQRRETLPAFDDFPTEDWKHLRTTNIIEDAFATVRHRLVRANGCVSNETALAMISRLTEVEELSTAGGATTCYSNLSLE
jgi:transposase-like protein